jgi:hypothetical protein
MIENQGLTGGKPSDQKSLFLDLIYLQQDAYDKVDV